MGGWMDRWMDGWMDGWMGAWMDGWIGGWIDGWMDGWMDERANACDEPRHAALFCRREFANLEGQQEAVVHRQAVLDLALVLEPKVRRHLHPVDTTWANVNEQHSHRGVSKKL